MGKTITKSNKSQKLIVTDKHCSGRREGALRMADHKDSHVILHLYTRIFLRTTRVCGGKVGDI